jgi:hypothetical protein
VTMVRQLKSACAAIWRAKSTINRREKDPLTRSEQQGNDIW